MTSLAGQLERWLQDNHEQTLQDSTLEAIRPTIERLIDADPLQGSPVNRILARQSEYSEQNRSLIEQITPMLQQLSQVAAEMIPPSGIEFEKPQKLLGLFTLHDPVADYGELFAACQAKLRDLLFRVNHEREQLSKGTISLEMDLEKLQQAVALLRRYRSVADQLIERFSQPDSSIHQQWAGGLKRFTEDLLVRENLMLQGVAAIRLIRENQLALMQNLERTVNHSLQLLRDITRAGSAVHQWRKALSQVQSIRADLPETTNEQIDTEATVNQLRSALHEMKQIFENTGQIALSGETI